MPTMDDVLVALSNTNEQLEATRLKIRKQISIEHHAALINVTAALQHIHDLLEARLVKTEWLAADCAPDCASTCECHK